MLIVVKAIRSVPIPSPATPDILMETNVPQWMLFNDDQVTPATESDVLNADAYLLFYNLRSLAGAPQ